MKIRPGKDPLAPLEGIVGVLLAFLVGLVLVFGVAMTFTDGGSMLGVGDTEVCVDNASIPMISDDGPSSSDREILGFKAHTESRPGETTVCNTAPGVKEQVLSALSVAPTFLMFLGFLFLTNRSIKRARAEGLFTTATARRVQWLGRYLLVGLLVAAVIEWLAKGLLLSTMVEGKGWADGPAYVSIASVIGALGIVTVGRILQRAVELQDEADATI